MRIRFIVLFLLCTVSLGGQNAPKRIALTPRSTVPMSVVAHGIDKKCSGVVLTTDASNADYLLEASETVDMRNGTDYGRIEYALLSLSGDVVFHTSTRRYDNAMKDVCKFMRRSK
jgi:hypothetical protein